MSEETSLKSLDVLAPLREQAGAVPVSHDTLTRVLTPIINEVDRLRTEVAQACAGHAVHADYDRRIRGLAAKLGVADDAPVAPTDGDSDHGDSAEKDNEKPTESLPAGRMFLRDYAKSRVRDVTAVSAAAKKLKFDSAHPNSVLTVDEQQSLDKFFFGK